jgi:hypothetical protein
MNQSYNVVVSSNLCTPETAGNSNTNKNYYIDWSAILPQGELELTFSFISENNVVHTFLNLPMIYVDFLSQANVDLCQASYQATSSSFLGLVYPTNLDINAHYSYLRADKNFNQPIYLANRPYSNNFNIRILNNQANPSSWVDDTTPTPQDLGSYVIVFHFKLLKKSV